MTRAPWSLRRRVALAGTVVGFALTVLFAITTVVVTEDYEYVLVDEILHGQAEDYSLRLAAGLPTGLPQTHRLSGYRAADPSTPRELLALPPGFHDDVGESDMNVGVFDTAAGRLIFVADLSDIERLERHLAWFLAGMVILGTALSGWVGWLLAGRAIAPVGRLASAVTVLPVRPQRTALALEASQDELGRLAGAIDDYQARLVEADERERAFFADASHELRTPIAVVQGVAELLLDEPTLDAATSNSLLRLERGVHELTDLLDVLLGLARRSDLRIEPLDACDLLREASALLAATRSGLHMDIVAGGVLHAPRREAVLLLRSMIRHVVQTETSGTLHLRFLPPLDRSRIRRGRGRHARRERIPACERRRQRTAAKPGRAPGAPHRLAGRIQGDPQRSRALALSRVALWLRPSRRPIPGAWAPSRRPAASRCARTPRRARKVSS